MEEGAAPICWVKNHSTSVRFGLPRVPYDWHADCFSCDKGRPEGESMSVRFDTTRRFTGTLLAALLVVALAIPACMTLACLVAPMSGDGMMGAMTITDCLDAATTHEGLLAREGSALTSAVLFVALLGLVLMTAFSAPLAAVGWAPVSSSDSPPPPLNPRGVRLLV